MDESVLGRFAVATSADLDDALASAQAAFLMWRDVGPWPAPRCCGAAALILERADALATALTREQGKPFAQARMEIEAARAPSTGPPRRAAAPMAG
uniref:Aldehyde dehydrogenase family protein n=1 Tax=Phenylobacterium glaciei TaxID=2803784 RepID=A0A974S9I9_9CAUL|nr:aldehyde dehydrogenase family protein [Phenylobacterium glaciei]